MVLSNTLVLPSLTGTLPTAKSPQSKSACAGRKVRGVYDHQGRVYTAVGLVGACVCCYHASRGEHLVQVARHHPHLHVVSLPLLHILQCALSHSAMAYHAVGCRAKHVRGPKGCPVTRQSHTATSCVSLRGHGRDRVTAYAHQLA